MHLNDKKISYLKSHKALLFPVVLFCFFLILTSYRVSGTSIGVYHSYLYGRDSKDSALVFGRPQTIRSDEWLVNTQLEMAQEKNGFNQINPNINGGRDMSIITDTPYRGWSAVFKPQNFAFFVLPFEFAFAFKWWLLIFSLLVSSYYFSLKIFPNKILPAAFASLIISFSPFVSWWYQTGTIAPLFYGFLILLVSMSIVDNTPLTVFHRQASSMLSCAIKILTLAYLLISFALLLYPPFQIPVAFVVAFYMLGYIAEKLQTQPKKQLLGILAPFVVATGLTVMISGIFFMTHHQVISAITGTAYPGKRVVASGGYDIKNILVTYLQPQLERKSRGVHYLENQSESSNFILSSLAVIVPSITLGAWIFIKHRKIEWVLFSLIICNLLFLAHLFVRLPAIVTKLSLLYLVPQQRLMIGMGFLAIVTMIYMARLAEKYVKLSRKLVLVILAYVAIYFILGLWAGLETRNAFPLFISSLRLIIILNAFLCLGLVLVFTKKYTFGLVLLALFSLGSSLYVNPLYKGLGDVRDGRITGAMQNVSTSKDSWGVVDNLYAENLPLLSNRQSISGIEFYPNTKFWSNFSGNEDHAIYNRYAHVLLTESPKNIKLVQPDLFAASISCDKKLAFSVDYILSSRPLDASCRKLVKTVIYPATTFYLYEEYSR